MKRRVFALTLALSMVLLAACGPKGEDNSSGNQSSSTGSNSDMSTMAPDGSTSIPDSSAPDASQPDGSQPDGSGSTSSDSSQPPVDEPQAQASLSLNRSDFTLFKAGATFQMKAGGALAWKSSDESVATVSDKGLVTAVAVGNATITVTDSETGLTASCIVRCNWEEQKPEEGGPADGSDSSSGSSSGDTSTPAGNVDLSAFASDIMGQYEFGMLQLLDADLMEQLYPGMGAVSAEQKLIYGTLMTMNNGEFGLVQVKDSKDVDTVKSIFQTRIDGMINGGAWYPEPTRIWTENSRVVSNGNYVMMVVHENCDAIVDAFNALF